MAQAERMGSVSTGQVDAEPVYSPYVPDETILPEFTWPALVVGAVLGIVFGASSLYLVLKVGMTVSASIPVAVLSITLFRGLSRLFGIRKATILENNIVQTAGSAGESLAFGVGVTMPALLLLGFEMDPLRVLVVSVLGGALGILMMIPLRRAFIVRRHGELKYPEGTACADVLIVGEEGGASAKTVFLGFGIAFVYEFLRLGLRLWKEVPSHAISWFKGAVASMEVNPTLLGVGYIIGPRVASIMVAGGLLSYFVFVPAIHFFADGLPAPLPPADKPIAEMDPDEMRRAYLLYVGAGAVAAGGIISLVRALPLIVGSVLAGVRDLRAEAAGRAVAARRTQQDLPMRFVAWGILGLVLTLAVFFWLAMPAPAGDAPPGLAGTLAINLLGAVLIVVFGFLFVTVSSRLTGEIGSSSNPISGMTVATLLLTCLIFLVLGWTRPEHRLTALSVAAVVCIAASNGGTTSQDLKTGFLVGATPRAQQWAILIGAVSSALVIGLFLVVLNRASTVYTSRNLPEPKVPIDVRGLTRTENAPGDPQPYRIWWAQRGNPQGVEPGKYLVDASGRIRYLVDPGINGNLKRRDDGTEVRKYDAPQARLMALITDGILTQKLPWLLVLLGVSIAIILELSRVPSLPFAVGVYLPLYLSTPVFAGGAVRAVVDGILARRTLPEERPSEAEAEMTPGVLLATGYIAGGAIAGVLVAFLSFSDPLREALARWQYREHVLEQSAGIGQAYRQAAQAELGPSADDEAVTRLAREIGELNADRLRARLEVPAGTVLALPGGKSWAVPRTARLAEIAAAALGDADQDATLFRLNIDRLLLPAGTTLSLPPWNAPAVGMFALLVVILAGVGRRRGLHTDRKTAIIESGPAAHPVA